MCIPNFFFIILASTTYENELILHILNISNKYVGQGHGGRKPDLCHSMAKLWMCITLNFLIILAYQKNTKINEFTYLKKFEIENVDQGYGG